MSRTLDPSAAKLPLWITVACLLAGVLLFFGNTVPALRDRETLRATEEDLSEQLWRYDHAIRRASLAGAGSQEIDLQSLFVAIDEKGMTIAEFCRAFPDEPRDDGPGRPRR